MWWDKFKKWLLSFEVLLIMIVLILLGLVLFVNLFLK
jgi:hypothetical protein